MVSQRVKKNACLLHYLAQGKPRICNAIIAESDRDTIRVLCECAKNLLAGNLELTPSHLRKLKRHKAGLRTLVRKSVSLRQKKTNVKKRWFPRSSFVRGKSSHCRIGLEPHTEVGHGEDDAGHLVLRVTTVLRVGCRPRWRKNCLTSTARWRKY